MTALPIAAWALIGYLLGSVPFGLLLTRAMGLGDVRKIGSGSIGATNVLRTGNKPLAAATLLLDAAKGAGAVLLARHLGGETASLCAGLAAVIGHLFPVWLGFRGGKGVATGYGVLIAVCWPAGLLAGAIWLIVAKLVKISSAAALTSFAMAPILGYFIAGRDIALLALAIAALVFLRHHANITRLLAGTEPRIGQRS